MIYHGNCHCGALRFEFRVDDAVKRSIGCSCIACRKQGYTWLVTEESLTVVRDDGKLTKYSSPTLTHEFCSVCGTGVFGEHSEGLLSGQRLLNVRTLRGVNPFDLERTRDASGTDMDSPLAVESRPTLPITGSCLCGSVGFELAVPLQEVELKEDNCSICARNAWAGAYATKMHVRIFGSGEVQDYRYGQRFMGFPFCKVCGVHVYLSVYGPPKTFVDRLSEDKKKFVRRKLDLVPVNIRVLDEVDIRALKIERSDEGTKGYEQNVLGLPRRMGDTSGSP